MGGDELPEYSVRVSSRARRVLLKVSADRGLEVVVPQGFDTALVPGIVRGKRDWCLRQLDRLSGAGRATESTVLPEKVRFPAVGESYRIDYAACTGRPRLSENSGGRLLLSASEPEQMRALLKGWLRRRAKARLPGLVAELSSETDLVCERVQVRLQRSRWGSYSGRGTLSLNARLLFLRPELARYVILHELCHSRHLNHSEAFWREVARYAPRYRVLEKLLRQAGRRVPAWSA
jgi:hypothetical protein